MKKKKAKILFTGILSGLLLLSMAGCGSVAGKKEVTPASLIKDMDAKTKDMKSANVNMLMDGNIKMTASGQSIDMTMKMDMDMEMVVDPIATKAKGKIDISYAGQSISSNMEMYQSEKDGKIESYVSTDGVGWMKTEVGEVPEKDTSNMMGLNSFAKFSKNFELSKEPVTVNDQECYQIKGKVDGETLETIMNTAMGSMGAGTGNIVGDVDWSAQEIPLEIAIAKKTKELVSIKMDMASIMKAALSETGAEASSDKFELTMTFKSINKTKAIEVPQEVIDSAQDVSDLDAGLIE